jgi:hypothetical protein
MSRSNRQREWRDIDLPTMRARQRDPVMVFRFALRERDWRLAWLLARALSREPTMRRRLVRELRRFEGSRPAPTTLPSLGVLGALLEPLAPDSGDGV